METKSLFANIIEIKADKQIVAWELNLIVSTTYLYFEKIIFSIHFCQNKILTTR